MSDIAAFARLMGAGWRLVRADALLPREIDPFLPAGPRVVAGFLRLFSGRAARAGRPGERLARVLETLGPAGIKLGQLMATRADIFGDEFARDLSHLKDRLDAFPLEVACAEIERSLGVPPAALYTSIEPAIAAASIAQAHPAVLLDGRKVAVKVLRPGIEVRVARDSETARLAARLLERFVPPSRRLEPLALVETVAQSLQLELDLRLEAGGAAELKAVMARDGQMTAPAVHWPGVGKRVLTLEWAQGTPLSDPAALDLPGLDRHEVAMRVVRAFLHQALDHGVFHADLHEGNLFVSAPANLTAVDFGIIGRLSKAERRYLAEILWGFINRDYDTVARAHFDAGYVPSDQSMALFAQALRSVGEPIIGAAADSVSMGRLLTQLFEITALFQMRLRPELVLLQKTMVAVEGVARRLDPTLSMWDAAKPVVQAYLARELSPAAKARDFLDEIIGGLRAIKALAEREPSPPVVIAQTRDHGWLWFFLGSGITAAVAWAVYALH